MSAGSIAGSAASGAAAGALGGPIGMGIGAAAGLAAGIIASRKTRGQKELEAANAAEAARIAAEQARLNGGNGGMSASKLLEARSAAQGQTAAAANQQIANIMRGSASGPSGMQQQQVAAVQDAQQRGLAQNESGIRSADLDYASQQRAGLEAQKAALFQRQLTTTGMQQQNQQALAASIGGAGQAAGMGAESYIQGGQSYADYIAQLNAKRAAEAAANANAAAGGLAG